MLKVSKQLYDLIQPFAYFNIFSRDDVTDIYKISVKRRRMYTIGETINVK